MAITRNPAGLNLIPLDTPEPWIDFDQQNWATLAGMNAVGGFAITPRDLDPATLVSTSRYITVNGGYAYINGQVVFVNPAEIQVPVSSAVVIWLDPAGTIQSGPAFPTTAAFAPLGYAAASTTAITTLSDYRNPIMPVGGTISIARVSVNGNYVMNLGESYVNADASNGALTVTALNPAANPNRMIFIRKADTGANAVTVMAPAPATIDGGASTVLTAKGTRILYSNGTSYDIII